MVEPLYTDTGIVLAAMAAYVVAGNLILRPPWPCEGKEAAFAVLNVLACYLMFFHGTPFSLTKIELTPLVTVVGYVAFGFGHWLLLQLVARTRESGWVYVGALLYSIVPLIFIKLDSVWRIIGFSYMAFRMAQAVLEVRRHSSLQVRLPAYISFLFFPLTLPIGPISPFGLFVTGLQPVTLRLDTLAYGLGRIAVGYIKFRFLATIAYQLTFANLWTDGFQHGVIDFLISSFAYFLYMYFNFAGFCDIVIGTAALIGVPVKENFNNPLLSTSLKDFWNRWHISLSEFVRDLVFTPLSLALVRRFGLRAALPASMIAAVLTFVVIGLWHGAQWGFFYFGLMHGLGFAANLLWESLTRLLPKNASAAWKRSGVAAVLGWALTLVFVACSMIFVEFPDEAGRARIFAAFRGGW
jgi:D-alanyl-lipoteichoic acid acyltransferase DltB (MBOAT superfamily)